MLNKSAEFYTTHDEMQKIAYFNNNIQNWINLLGNNIFTVQFLKKNGDLRTITARLNCHKYTKQGKPQNKVNNETLCVFDMKNKCYRNVNINRVVTLSCHHVVFRYNIHYIMKKEFGKTKYTITEEPKPDVLTTNYIHV
jgi:hypothetical protein